MSGRAYNGGVDVGDLFKDGGRLSSQLDGYRYRAQQAEMARTVEESLGGGQFVLQAEAGIGKSFAYLTPIIESQTRTLISTGSRILQDQLLHKDIPFLAKALQRPVRAVVLKGRANYVCHLKVEDNSKHTQLIDDDNTADWQKIVEFSNTSTDGDIAHADPSLADSPAWRNAISTRESCTKKKCAHYDNCFLYRARNRAREAEIVIVNHHLFLSDLRLKDEEVAEILPNLGVVLFDEAHQLPTLAPELLGQQVSSGSLTRLADDVDKLAKEIEKNSDAEEDDRRDDSKEIAERMKVAVRRLKLAVSQWVLSEKPKSARARETHEIPAADLKSPSWTAALASVQKEIVAMADALPNSTKANKYKDRLHEIDDFLTTWTHGEATKTRSKKDDADADEGDSDSADKPAIPIVRWASASAKAINLISAPVSGEQFFADQWNHQNTVIFTSATFGGDAGIRGFCQMMGLDEPEVHRWGSPYNFAEQAVLYFPTDLPQPNERDYNRAAVDAALPLIRANDGRALLLFTTHRAMSEAYAILQATLGADGYQVLKQGDRANDQLLAALRTTPRCVLLGSRMFWQGVDIKGDALSLVVIDKIPFAPPDDPFMKALDNWRQQRGENLFQTDQLPTAITLMQQAAGRLIRDFGDYGVLMVADPRIHSKHYGKAILKSLPPMRITRDPDEAMAFLQQQKVRQEEVEESRDFDTLPKSASEGEQA